MKIKLISIEDGGNGYCVFTHPVSQETIGKQFRGLPVGSAEAFKEALLNECATALAQQAVVTPQPPAPDVLALVDTEMIIVPEQRPDVDMSDLDNLGKSIKALGLLVRAYTNALQAGTHTQKTVAQVKADFKAFYDGLP